MEEDLGARVARQFPSLYLTLVSVLVGLVLSDLFSTVHARVILWPLTLQTTLAWFQIFTTMLAVLAAWVAYSHLGLLRNRLPTIWDTVDAAMVLVTIPVNAAIGQGDGAPWFFWAAVYSLLGMIAIKINLWQAAREPHLRHLTRLGRLGGPFMTLWLGAPGFLLVAAGVHFHRIGGVLELAAAASGMASAVIVAVLFLREWREAVTGAPSAASQAPLAPQEPVV
jgi:hypothetical protein